MSISLGIGVKNFKVKWQKQHIQFLTGKLDATFIVI